MRHVLFIALFFLSSIAFGQNIWTVDNNPAANPDFASIDQAVDAADPGDFIYVQPSFESYGEAEVDKLVHLRSQGHYSPASNEVGARIEQLQIRGGSDGSSVSGFDIGQVLNYQANVQKDDITVSNCRYERLGVGGHNWTIEGCVSVTASASYTNVKIFADYQNTLIHHNIFQNYGTSGTSFAITGANATTLEFNNIYVLQDNRLIAESSDVEFQNSVILSTDTQNDLEVDETVNITFDHCLSYNYNGFSISLEGSDNLEDTDPNFTNLTGGSPLFSYDNIYVPSAGSPLEGNASDGDNIGIYNESYSFDQVGHPVDLPYILNLDLLNPGVVQGDDLQIEFSAFGN